MATFELSHLAADEKEYELRVRGLPYTLTRTRESNLADVLSREALGVIEAPDRCLNKDFVDEVNQCFRKLEELEKLLITLADYAKSDFNPHVRLRSRLSHLLLRLCRIKSNDSRIIIQVNGLAGKCDKYINHLNEAITGKVSLSDLLKGEKFVSQMSFLGISSSTEEPDVEGATALPEKVTNLNLDGDNSIARLLEEEKTPKSIMARKDVHVGPSEDAGEELSDYIDVLDEEILGIFSKQKGKDNLPKPICQTMAPKTGAIKKNPFYGQMGSQAIPTEVPRKNFETRVNPDRFTGAPKLSFPDLSPVKNVRFPEDTRAPRQQPRQEVRAELFPEPNYEEVRRFEPPNLGNMRHPRTNYRNPVPNWHLVFTGDGKGLSVIDFIKQVYYMARADRVSEDELVASAIHLFSGPARSWYMAVERSIETWEQLCSYLYEDFTSQDGDFGLMKDLEQRHQGNGEPFVVYLAAMVNLFDQLLEPLSELKKVDMVTRNMLPYLIERLALIDIPNLNILSRTCKRIEDAKNKMRGYRSAQVVEVPRREPRRQMYELEAAPLLRASNGDACWNCKEPGHFFKACQQPKMRVFCYLCGEVGQLARGCSSCREMGNQDGRLNRPNERDGQYR